MIAHVLRLSIGEWHKLRRRWIPWILLGLVVFLTQSLVWAGYAAYHLVDEVSEEGLSDFTLPSILTIDPISLHFLVIPIMILAASVVGVEYGLGTLRTTLTRGVGRWQLLSAKLIMLMVAVIAGFIVLSAFSAIAGGVIAGIAVIIPPAEGEALIGTEPQAWLDAAIGAGKVVYALAPYVALGVFLAVVTQSTAQGISISMGYYLLELIAAPLIGGIAGWLESVLDVALLGSNVGEWMSTANTTDTLRAFFVILAYTVVFVAAALWIFQRRDVTGAKGE